MSDRANKENVPKALREVWKCKEALYKEVASLPPGKRIAALLDRANEASMRMRQSMPALKRDIHARRSKIAAEPVAEYRVKRQVKRRKGNSRP